MFTPNERQQAIIKVLELALSESASQLYFEQAFMRDADTNTIAESLSAFMEDLNELLSYQIIRSVGQVYTLTNLGEENG